MKRLVIAVIAVLTMINVAGAGVVLNTTWDAGVTYVGQDNIKRDIYNINVESAVPMTKVIKQRTDYVDTPIDIIDGELVMGNCIYDIRVAHHSVSLLYEWDYPLTNVGVSFDYTARQHTPEYDYAYLRVAVWVIGSGTQVVFRTSESGHFTLSAEYIKSFFQHRGYTNFNKIYIIETDIGTDNSGTLDNIIITADNVPVNEPSVTVQKAGLYTAELVDTDATVDVYVNGTLSSTFYSGNGNIGVLEVGDEIRLVANGDEAESIEDIDYQSWNFFYAEGTIQIYVEDPPICEPVVEYVEVEVEVPGPTVYVNVPGPTEYVEVPCTLKHKKMKGNNGKHKGHEKKAKAHGYRR